VHNIRVLATIEIKLFGHVHKIQQTAGSALSIVKSRLFWVMIVQKCTSAYNRQAVQMSDD
jgi:hypothetical protein